MLYLRTACSGGASAEASTYRQTQSPSRATRKTTDISRTVGTTRRTCSSKIISDSLCTYLFGQGTLDGADSAVQEKIVNFISANFSSSDEQSFAIPTALIVVGPSIASHGPFFERLGRKVTEDANSVSVILTSSECPNLKTLLKNLIKKATLRVEEDDDDDEELDRPPTSSRYGPKLLNYDLGLIQEWQKKKRVSSIVVAIQDSEAFDAGLLNDTIDLFQ